MEQAKKECILIEAARAFSRWGFRKASIDDIAKAAGVGKGTIYLAADSKEDLFFQALHREVRHWVAEVSKMIDPRVAADTMLEAMSRASIGYLEASPLVRDLLFGKTRELLPLWGERLDDLRRLGAANVAEVLRLGIRQKIFREDLDIELVASLLQDVQIAGYALHGKPSGEVDLERRQQVGLDLIFNGLRRPAHHR